MTNTTITYTEPQDVPAEETQLQAFLNKLEITTTPELKWAVQATAEVKTKLDAVKAERDSFVKPLKKVVDALSKKYKPAIDSLTECEKIVKGKISEYDAQQRAEKANAMRLAEQSAQKGDTGGATQFIAQAAAYDLPKISGLSLRHSHKAEIIDKAALVLYCTENKLLHFLEPDVKAIEQAAKKDMLPELPGVVVDVKTTVAITTSKVEA